MDKLPVSDSDRLRVIVGLRDGDSDEVSVLVEVVSPRVVVADTVTVGVRVCDTVFASVVVFDADGTLVLVSVRSIEFEAVMLLAEVVEAVKVSSTDVVDVG